MDGATNVNPSNAPHVLTSSLTSREEKKIKRSLAKEATAAEKHVAQVAKALKSAEKGEIKAEKVCLQIPGGEHRLYRQLSSRCKRYSGRAKRQSNRSTRLRRHSATPNTSMISLSRM